MKRGDSLLADCSGSEDGSGHVAHSDIRTTMNVYTQDDRDEKQTAQGAFLTAAGLGSRLVVQ